ncbi:MAG: hypothetical protein Q8N89_17645 [Azonexus sp.]|nr:hypothetical protein [Azonexus sp.]
MRIGLWRTGPVSVSVYLVFGQYIAEGRRFGQPGAGCHGQPEKVAKTEMPESRRRKKAGDALPLYPQLTRALIGAAGKPLFRAP